MKLRNVGHTIEKLLQPIHGKVSVMIETEEGQFGFQENECFPSASLIKIPIMIEAYRQAQEELLKLSKKVSIPTTMRVGGMGVTSYLSDTLEICLEDLISLMIMISDNTATNMIIEEIGMDSVNRLAEGLHCYQTRLERKMMDFEAIKIGKDNYTSASDMIQFLKEIVEGQTLLEKGKKAAYRTLLHQQFRTKLPYFIKEHLSFGSTIAHKTGELPGTEHDAGIFNVNGKQAYIAVLTTELDDQQTGQRIISQIGKLLFDYLTLG
jgi:beta-lactamase class A